MVARDGLLRSLFFGRRPRFSRPHISMQLYANCLGSSDQVVASLLDQSVPASFSTGEELAIMEL